MRVAKPLMDDKISYLDWRTSFSFVVANINSAETQGYNIWLIATCNNGPRSQNIQSSSTKTLHTVQTIR